MQGIRFVASVWALSVAVMSAPGTSIAGSINGNDVADDSLTGADINESTLTNAQVRDFALSTGTSGGDTLKSFRGLTLTWSASGGSGDIFCYLRASTSAQELAQSQQHAVQDQEHGDDVEIGEQRR